MRAKPKRLEPYPLADWQTQAEEALRAVAPDLAGWPLYLVPRSTFAGTKMETLCGVECGSTHTAYDLVLKPLLQLMGWWRGRGVTAIIDDTKLGKYFSSHGFAGACLGVAAHEVAHGLVDGWGTAELFDDELARDELAPLSFFLHRAAARESKQSDDVQPWTGHEPTWIRAAAHLGFRLSRRDRTWNARGLVHVGRYLALSSAARYEQLLLGELEDRSAEPIRDILASPPPVALDELFQCDVRRFHRKQREP